MAISMVVFSILLAPHGGESDIYPWMISTILEQYEDDENIFS
jgi:hypothetical protein